MGTNTRNSLTYYLRAAQTLQLHAKRCRVTIDYKPEDKAFFVVIADGGTNPYAYEYEFRSVWAVANQNHNYMEQLKAIWEQYEAN